MASSPSRCTRETLPRPTFDPFSSFGLPPNSALSSLPPLPDTPRQEKRSFAPGTFDPPASARSNRTNTMKVSRHERMGDLAGMLGDNAVDVDDNVNIGGQALDVGSDTRRPAQDTGSKRDLFSPPKYPVLSTRQSSINLARTQTTPYKRSPSKHTSHLTPAKIPLPLSPQAHPTTLHLPPSPSPNKSSAKSPAPRVGYANEAGSPSHRSVSGSFQLPVIPDVSLLGDMTLPAGRESLGSDVFDLGIAALRPRPTNLPEEDEMGYAKSMVGGSTTPTRATGVGKTSATPTRTHPPSAARHEGGGGRRLDESTLLPSTPAGMVDLLSSTNALYRVPPPWIPSNSTRSTDTVHATSFVDPSTILPRSVTIGRIAEPAPAAIAAPPAPSITISKSSSQRTFPASLSSSSLTSVGEEPGDQQAPFTSKGNESALFPVSPARHRHLLSDDEQLLHEAPIDGPSIYLPQLRRTPVDVGEGDKSTLFPVSPQKYRHLLADNEQLTHETPMDEASLLMPPPRIPAPSSSFPSSRQETSISASTGPSHLDKSAMFPTSPAKWRHLLSDEEQLVRETPFPLEGASVVLPPPSRYTAMTSRTAPSPVKAKPILSRQGSPQKVRSSPVKLPFGSYTSGNMAGGDATLDVEEMMARMSKPKRPSGTEESFIDLLHADHTLDDIDGPIGDESFLPAGLRPLPLPRSKSMPGIALARSPTKSSAPPKISPSKTMTFAQESTTRSRTLSRPEPAVAASNYATSTTTATPGASRTRSTVAPHTTGTRRISLSAGNVPMPKSASMKTLDLPPPTPRTSQPRPSAHVGHVRSKSTSSGLPSTGTGTGIATATRQSMVPPTATSGRSLGPSSSAVSRARPSVAPSVAIEPRTRLGSTTSLAPAASVRPASSRMAPPPNLPITSKLSSRPSVVPTRPSAFSAASAPTGRSADLPKSRSSKPPVPVGRTSAIAAMPPPSFTARPGGLPRPVASERVIPTTTSMRTFGGDGSSATNRVPRPTVGSSAASSTTQRSIGKASLGPIASPSKRTVDATTSIKSRALSTPASTVSRSSSSRSLGTTSSSSSSTSTVRPIELLKKTSTSATGGVGSLPVASSRLGSHTGLPRPSGRIPTRAESKSSISTVPVAPSVRSGLVPPRAGGSTTTSSGLAGLRERLDRLQARQQSGKAAK